MTSNNATVYHYLDIGRLGRGEVVKLFMKDAGIDFKEDRFPYDNTWPEKSKALQNQGLTRTGKVPVLEYKGLILSQHIPILRYLSRDLDSYDGETNEEKYVVDSVADVYIDWRSQWAANLGKTTEQYKTEVVPEYYRVLALYYSDNSGPYLLGDKITYADFAVYQSIDNDRRTETLPTSLPKPLIKLQEAIEKRPNIAEYIKQNSQ